MPPSSTNCICATARRYPLPASSPSKMAKARLFGRWQPGHQVTITVSHPDYVNLSRLYRGRLASLTELPEHLTRLRQRHNVPGTRIDIQLRYR